MPSQDEQARRDRLLEEIIQAYEAAETHETVNDQEWLERYPEVAQELEEFIANRRWMEGRLASGHGLEGVKSIGNYELLEEIGRGGMGVVYRARQKGLDRIVAVKTILGGDLATDSDVSRFRREARCAARLRHQNIVSIYEVGEHEGLYYFSMEFVEGHSLAHATSEGALPAAQAADYLRQIAQGIHYAHQQGILHRDLKPSNVLLDLSGRPMITDFGLAKMIKQGSSYTVRGAILGTPSYMSPEQADGRLADVNERSDVYSLGAVLYEEITGKPPFRGDTSEQILAQVRNVPALPPRVLNPGVPVALESICLKCLEKDPAKRYGSARDLAEECQRFLEDQPVLAQPPSIWGSRLRRYSPMASLETNIASIGLLAGPIVALMIGLGPRFGLALDSGRPQLNTMAAIVALMAVWWVTEAIPSAATAFLPLILLPLLGIVKLADVSKLYMHDIILLTLGGLLISTAVEESGLIRRFALRMVGFTGDNPQRIVLGFMIATAGVSLWGPNVITATIIMLPVALGVLSEIEETTAPSARRKNLATALMLGIAYAATIGGMATPFGALATRVFIATYGQMLNITALRWMAWGIPFTLVMMAVCWILLTHGVFPLGTESLLGGKQGLLNRQAKLGPMRPVERRMLAIAVLTALLWVLSEPVQGWGWGPLLGLPSQGANAVAALTMAVMCFVLPAGGQTRQRLLEWDSTTRVPWGVLFLFGGGLALAAGIKATGLDTYAGNMLASILKEVPSNAGKMLGTTTFVVALTQMMSNFAVVEMTSPILLHVANQLSIEPRLLMVSGILGAFSSFLLPASTPSNAVVYGSGKVTVRDMIKAGFWLSLAGLVIGVICVYLLAA